jgi:hypothetical protein
MNAPDAIERLRAECHTAGAFSHLTIRADDARAILDHTTALTAERDAAVAEQAVREQMRAYYLSQGLLTVQMPTLTGSSSHANDRCTQNFDVPYNPPKQRTVNDAAQ